MPRNNTIVFENSVLNHSPDCDCSKCKEYYEYDYSVSIRHANRLVASDRNASHKQQRDLGEAKL